MAITTSLAEHAVRTAPARRLPRARRTIIVLLLGCAAAVLGIEFAPMSVGGPNQYLITSGTSMLPTIRPESAVVIRREPAYHRGDVVAYRNPDLDAVVLHRIVGTRGRHYIFKGDNNQFKDFYEPTKKDIVGKEIFHSSVLGIALSRLRTPLVGAALCFAFTIWVLYGVGREEKSRSRGAHRPRC